MADAFERVRRALADRYVVQRELGHGGMATVYLAQDPKSRRQVAIKVLRPELAAALGAERFAREIATAAPLAHPHILPLYDSGEADGVLYYVMPFIEGESLRDRLEREGPLPLEDALQITQEVAEALGYAHSRGIVHRDIKPDNILLSEDHAVVADFGIARAIEQAGGERLTDSGIAIGTPAYMSPEQASGSSALDGRSDLYSLGCMLYEMLSGEPPHTGPSAQAVIAKKLAAPAPRISVVREMVPPVVEAALTKALARTPADRFATTAAFGAALRAEGAPAPPIRSRRWRWAGAVIVVVALSAAAVAVWRLRPSGTGAQPLDHDLIAALPFRVTTTAPELRELAAQVPTMFWTKVTGQYGPRSTDAASVERAWTAAGGTPDGGLPEAEERRIARAQGAGLLVRGVVGGNRDSVIITGSLERTVDGRILEPPRTVAGPRDRSYRLMDSLVVLLLAREFGAAANDIPRLSRHPPEAVQAYLAGQRMGLQGPASFGEAGRLLDQALEADSTFLEAAFWKFVFGERDMRAGRFVWSRLDQLSPRDRAFFRA
jgi:eukaryotic-like serine/threonine-protein kinase